MAEKSTARALKEHDQYEDPTCLLMDTIRKELFILIFKTDVLYFNG